MASYQQHARELRPLIAQMAWRYQQNPAWRVGVGSICQRAGVDLIRQVCTAVAEELPGVPLHVGVPLRLFRSRVALPEQVVSVDSSTWNGLWYRGREAWRASGLPQRQWTIMIALPRYLTTVERAWAREMVEREAVLLEVETHQTDPAQPEQPTGCTLLDLASGTILRAGALEPGDAPVSAPM